MSPFEIFVHILPSPFFYMPVVGWPAVPVGLRHFLGLSVFKMISFRSNGRCLGCINAFVHVHVCVHIQTQISVQSLSRVRLFVTPWIAARQASLSVTNSQSSLKLMSIESVMPSSHLILCRPLLLLPLIPPSIRVFSNESTLHMRWPKYWSFSFSITPSKEHLGLISFRVDWLDLLAVQGTLKSLLQHHQGEVRKPSSVINAKK